MSFLTYKKDCQANYTHLSVLADIFSNMSKRKGIDRFYCK